ncbi:BTAD domain-containing putative transcriptional regulator [Streptomyces tanashiensis]|uniref:AfsR/SARP family transcriptional regulator n=1 Tax=Streptomyces tanashiensis TaxID=67367 RepID=UPI0036EDFE05
MRFGVLGPLTVEDAAGAPRPIAQPKSRALLAALLLQADQIVSFGTVMSALWGERPPASAVASLHNHMARLRKDLGPDVGARLRTVGQGFRLSVADGELDCEVFARHGSRALEALRSEEWSQAEQEAEAALRMWRGEPLADTVLAVEHPQIAYFEAQRLRVLECRFEACLRLGRLDGLSAELDLLVGQYPLRETLHRQLMLVLDRTGRRAEALARFHSLRRLLVDELGVEPGPAVQQALEAILSGRNRADTIRPEPAAALHASAPRPAQLPSAPAHFVGRSEEASEIRSTLLQARSHPALVVITGMAGVGKTGLALHIAQELRTAFPDGQLYLNLHAATPGASPLEPAQALSLLLQGMGVDPRTVSADAAASSALLRSTLADRRVLLVLDDVSSANQLRPLLPAGAGCAVLVTSRLPLATLGADRHVRLEPLSPGMSTLLLEKASGRRWTAEESAGAAHVADLCGRLPLALRISAARLATRRTLTVEALAERLTAHGARLDHLELDDLSVRRSLSVSQEALATSDQARDRDAALALTRLGGLDLPEYSPGLLARLMDVDELRADLALERLAEVALLDETRAYRYSPHDLVREFARELAAGHTDLVRHHEREEATLHWYVSRATACARHLRHRSPALRDLGPAAEPGAPDHPPFRDTAAAAAWADQEAENLIFLAGRPDGGRLGPQRSIELIQILSPYLHDRGLVQERRALTHRAVAAARQSGNRKAESAAIRALAVTQYSDGYVNEALLLIDESLAMDAQHSPTTRMLALGNRAALLKELGRHAEARAALREALALRPEDLDDFHQALLLGHQGYVSEPTDLRLAVSYHLQSLELAARIGAEVICLVALSNTGHCHLALQEPEAALSRFAAALAITATGVMHWNAEREIRVGKARALRLLGRPGEARRECETLLGLASKRGDTYTRGLAEHEYGHALRACGDERAAREHWRIALRALDGTDALVLPELHHLVGPRPTPEGSHHPATEHRGPYEAPGARDHRDFEAV